MATENYGVEFSSKGGQELVNQFRGIETSADKASVSLGENAKVIDKVKASSAEGQARLKGLADAAKGAGTASEQLAKQAKQANTSLTSLEKQTKLLSNSFNQLKGVLAGAFTIFSARKLIEFADGFTNIRNQIRLVAKDTNDLNKTYNTLLGVANRSRQDFDATVKTYTLLAQASTNLKLSQTEVARATESLGKIFTISGATAETAKLALVQFSQGVGAGALKGQELNSVLLGTNGAFARLIADALKAKNIISKQAEPTDALRKLAAEGKLTAKVVLDALGSSAKGIDLAFAKIAPSIQTSMVVLNNQLIDFVGNTDNAYGVSALLGQGILFAAENVDLLVIGIATLAAALAISTLVTGAAAAFTALSFAIGAVGAVLAFVASTPFLLLAAALGALAVYIIGPEKAFKLLSAVITEVTSGFPVLRAKIDEWGTAAGATVTAVTTFFSEGYASLIQGGSDTVDAVVTYFVSIPEKLKGLWAMLMEAAAKTWADIVAGARKLANDAYQAIYDKFKQIADYINGSWVGSIIATINRVIAAAKEAIALAQKAFSSSGGSSAGFRDGGQFRVPGAGGTDTRMIQFMATPGERVTVETPQQQMASSIPKFRDGGVVLPGAGGGGQVVSLLGAILAELRGIKGALTGGSSGTSSMGGTGSGGSSSSGAGGSIPGFSSGNLFGGGGASSGGSGGLTGLNDNISPTQQLLNNLLDKSGAPSVSYDNTDMFNQYMENKAKLLTQFANASDNGLSPAVKSEMIALAKAAYGYDSKKVMNQFDKFASGKVGFQDIVSLSKKSSVSQQIAEILLGSANSVLTGGIVSVSGGASETVDGKKPLFSAQSDLNRSNLGGSLLERTRSSAGYNDNDRFATLRTFGFKSSGFRDGGDFTVPGGGAVDSRLVQFYATPGEQVSIKTPNQQSNGDSGKGDKTVIVQGPLVQINTPDADSFRRNETQVQLQMKNLLERIAS